jgi:CubicO group peptidase (beta-lactamase class C family)
MNLISYRAFFFWENIYLYKMNISLKIRNVLLFLLLVNLLNIPAIAQNYKDSLDQALSSIYSKSEFPGFSTIIVDKKGILYQKSLGYADMEKKRAFGTHTIQNIGSVSKTFIALALMKAIEMGYFDLETNINAILPFKVTNPYFPEEQIKIKHLVTHTSGIIDNNGIYTRSYLFKHDGKTDPAVLAFMRQNGYTGDLSDTTLKTFMFSYLSDQGKLYSKANFSNSKPAESAAYSNIGSALVAYLIEIKAGMSFADFSRKYTLEPLKMNQSGWHLTSKNIKSHSLPYFDVKKKITFPLYSLTTYPDGGLRTSTNELSKYVSQMMLGLEGNSTLLSKASFELMFKPRFSADKIPENFSLKTRNKGVLWNLYNDGFIGHDGDDPGVISNVLFNKEIGIVFLSNIYLENRKEILDVMKKYGPKIKRE